MKVSVLFVMLLAAIAAGADAVAQPAGLATKDGLWTAADGRQLYISGTRLLPPCVSGSPCDESWTPLSAEGEVLRKNGWSTVRDVRSASGWTWAYRSRPLYVRTNPALTDPAAAFPGWTPARAIGANAVDYDVVFVLPPSRWVGPDFRGPHYPPEYLAASIRAEETGDVAISYCVAADGTVLYPELRKSSGFPRLDLATEKWVERMRLTPGRLDGLPVTVCGVTVEFTWQIPALAPPSINR